MYSVLIQNQKTIESFHEFHPLFMEALDSGKIGYCRWMESGSSIDTALPELCELTKDKEEWRAVIIRVEDGSCMQQFPTVFNNPYDFEINADGADCTKESPVPLIRLTHILGGVPSPELEFECEQIIERNRAPRTIYVPKKSLEREMDHAALMRKYDFDGKLPSEIVVISLRQQMKDSLKSATRKAWQNDREINSSEFWKRNNYPSICRFLVYDYENQGPVQKDADMFNFWMSVMLLVTNDIDPSSMQAYKLYRINTLFDPQAMTQCFQQRVNRLAGARSFFDGEIKRDIERKLEEKTPTPDYQMHQGVVMDWPSSATFEVDSHKFGMTSDSHEMELRKWHAAKEAAEKGIQGVYKQSERSLDMQADAMRVWSVMQDYEVQEMNRFQEEDMTEELNQLFDDVVELQSGLPSMKVVKTKQLEELEQEVKSGIACRVERNSLFMIVGIFALMSFLGVLPAIVYYFIRPTGKWYGILCTGLVFFAVLILAIWLVLLIHRIFFVRTIDDYNAELNSYMATLTKNVNMYTDFVTKMVSYSRGKSYFRILRRRRFVLENSYDGMQKHIRAVNLFMDKIQRWSKGYYLSVNFNPSHYENVMIDIDTTPRHNTLYTFETGEEYQIPINTAGDMVISPFVFVKQLEIVREELYEDAGSNN